MITNTSAREMLINIVHDVTKRIDLRWWIIARGSDLEFIVVRAISLEVFKINVSSLPPLKH